MVHSIQIVLNHILMIVTIDPDTGHCALHVAVILNIDNMITKLLQFRSSTAVQDLEVCSE